MRQKEPMDFQSIVFRFLGSPEIIGALFKKKKEKKKQCLLPLSVCGFIIPLLSIIIVAADFIDHTKLSAFPPSSRRLCVAALNKDR